MTNAPFHVLFVCTGNTCRSPMCEAYFKSLCDKAGDAGKMVSSAGISAVGGSPASINSVAVMRDHGIGMDGFRSTRLTLSLLERADLIVAMTGEHRYCIGRMLPSSVARVRLLMEFSDSTADVDDPYGGDEQEYRRCFEVMKKALDNLFLDLRRAEKNS